MRSLKVFLLFVFLLSVSGWCACVSGSMGLYCGGGAGSCTGCPTNWNGTGSPPDANVHASVSGKVTNCGNETGTVTISCTGSRVFIVTSSRYQRSCGGSDYSATGVFIGLMCDDQCSADSVACYNEGKQFVRNGESCSCVDICGSMRSQCEGSGGSFTGRVLEENGEKCCSATCDRCHTTANEQVVKLKEKYCCDAGFAPPVEGSSCYSPPGISGCGMTTLQRLPNTLEYQCRDPNSSQEASQAYYEKCFPCEGDECKSSSSQAGGSSSSGDGNSSEGDGNSSHGNNNYPEGCHECPWLDSILDTLVSQKGYIEQIYMCVVYPSMCQDGESESEKDSVVINLDSNMLVGVTANQDSIKRLLDSIIAVGGRIDTGLMTINGNLGGSSYDSTLGRVIQGGLSTIDTGLIRIRGDIVDIDEHTRKRLDSLIKLIPTDIMDSIVKYQDSAIDRFDSIMWGKGVGFSLVDSLTDTVVKYFKMSNHYDSIYYRQFAAFDSSLGERLDNMSIGTDFDPLGYGDTASTTLRGDMDDLKGLIASFDSSVKSELSRLVDSQKSFYSSATGYGDGTSTLKGDLAGLKEAIEGIQGGNSYVDSQLRLGSYDTNSTYNGYLTGYDTAAVQFATNLGSALGGALHDSTYKGIFVRDSSTLGGDTAYRLLNADSLHQVMQNSNDSMKSALADTMQIWFDELRKDFMLVNFDSAVIAPLGAKVPNTNTCPADCFKIDLSSLGGVFSGVREMNWGICEARIGPLDVLQFIRLILRIVTALTCIYIGLWIVSGRKS